MTNAPSSLVHTPLMTTGRQQDQVQQTAHHHPSGHHSQLARPRGPRQGSHQACCPLILTHLTLTQSLLVNLSNAYCLNHCSAWRTRRVTSSGSGCVAPTPTTPSAGCTTPRTTVLSTDAPSSPTMPRYVGQSYPCPLCSMIYSDPNPNPFYQCTVFSHYAKVCNSITPPPPLSIPVLWYIETLILTPSTDALSSPTMPR